MENREASLMIVSEAMIFRRGLRSILSSEFTVNFTEASSPEEALLLASNTLTQTVLIDAELPARSAFSLCRQLIESRPSIGVLILSDFDWDILLVEAWNAGALGVVLKQADPTQLITAVKLVQAGRSSFTAAQHQRMHIWERNVGYRITSLSAREQEVMSLVVRGLGNREISRRLVVSENTIERHVSSILNKLDVESRSEIIAFLNNHHIEYLLLLICSGISSL